jgi:hypothetical protein
LSGTENLNPKRANLKKLINHLILIIKTDRTNKTNALEDFDAEGATCDIIEKGKPRRTFLKRPGQGYLERE